MQTLAANDVCSCSALHLYPRQGKVPTRSLPRQPKLVAQSTQKRLS